MNRLRIIAVLVLIGLALPLILLGWPAVHSATEMADVQFIDRVPFVIWRPGTYVVTRNLDFNSNGYPAINIKADHVTVNLNGYRLRCISADPKRNCVGIHAWKQDHITIRNGCIDGFLNGIQIRDVWKFDKKEVQFGRHRVESVLLKNNTHHGILVQGECCTIANNTVSHTGPCALGENTFCFGIECVGACCRVLNNRVYDTLARDQGEAVGISFSDDCYGSMAKGNVIVNSRPAKFRSIGIWVGHRSFVTLCDNQLCRFTWGLTFSSPTRGLYRRNTVVDCDIPVCLCGESHKKAGSAGRLRWRDGGDNVLFTTTQRSPHATD